MAEPKETEKLREKACEYGTEAEDKRVVEKKYEGTKQTSVGTKNLGKEIK